MSAPIIISYPDILVFNNYIPALRSLTFSELTLSLALKCPEIRMYLSAAIIAECPFQSKSANSSFDRLQNNCYRGTNYLNF